MFIKNINTNQIKIIIYLIAGLIQMLKIIKSNRSSSSRSSNSKNNNRH